MSGKKSPEEAETTTRAGDDTDAEWRNDDENIIGCKEAYASSYPRNDTLNGCASAVAQILIARCRWLGGGRSVAD